MTTRRHAPKHSAKTRTSGRLSPEQFKLRQHDDPLARMRAQRATEEKPGPTLDPYLDAARHILTTRASERNEPLDEVAAKVEALARSLSESTVTPDHHWPDLFDTLPAPDEHGLTWRINPKSTVTPTSGPGLPTNTGTVWAARHGKISPQNAREFVRDINPMGRPRTIAKVKDGVVELVIATGATSPDSLRRLTTICYAFAQWCLGNTPDGEFVPSRDFNEDRIHDFLVQGLHGVGDNTKSTYRSELRRLGGSRAKPRSLGRKRAQPPYPARVARLLWTTALELDDWVAPEMRTLLALTFGAGARAAEINQMRVDQVQNRGTRVVVELVQNGAVVRDIPVYGEQAQWIRERSKDLNGDVHLFRPGYKNRRNAISDLVAKATARSDVFDDFKTLRARHTWICHYLARGINFNALCQAADVGQDSNLFADLAPYLPPVTAADIRREFDRVHKSTPSHKESA